MADLEKVIEGLERAIKNVERGDAMLYIIEYKDLALLKDALELLRTRLPRVMTPEEVRDLKPRDVVWIEQIDDPDEDVQITEYINRIHVDKDRSETGEPYCEMLFKHIRETLEDYASYWRCWTARPSHEQLMETPWGMKSWNA